ncbi:MAG: hypothetical protein KDK36_20500, partial [Leptospiraceae bacterium]|nr:hypothetical protein [Leptospiraceae bacterium]
PIYIPLYLGRSIKSKVIFNSNNIMYNPNGESPILYMDANYLPSNYAGIALGLKIDILGLNLGMEFGYIKMFSPGLEYNIRPSILNRVNLEFNEYYIYNELIKKAYSAPEEIKLNYGILVGISF